MAYYIDWSKKRKLKKTMLDDKGHKIPLYSYRFVYKEGRDEQGKPLVLIEKTFRFPTDREAKKALLKWAQDIENNGHVKPQKISFAAFVDIWEKEHLSKKRKTTIDSERSYAWKHAVPNLGTRNIANITTRELQSVIDNMQKTHGGPAAPSTKSRFYSVLRDIFKLAEKWQYITKNPMDNVDPPKVSPPKHDIQIDDNDLIRFYNAIHKHASRKHRLMIEVPLYLGLRRGEMLALEWDCINFETQEIEIRQNWTTGEIGELKTGDSHRNLKIPKSLLEELKIYRNEWLHEKLACGGTENYLFCERPGGLPYSRDWPTEWLNIFIKRHNLPKLVIKDLRTLFATNMAKNGSSPKETQQALGHSTPNTSMTYYIKVQESTKRLTADRMDALRLSMKSTSH